jgi:hypothetical protein
MHCLAERHLAVRAVSKNRPKYPMLDIPFISPLLNYFSF